MEGMEGVDLEEQRQIEQLLKNEQIEQINSKSKKKSSYKSSGGGEDVDPDPYDEEQHDGWSDLEEEELYNQDPMGMEKKDSYIPQASFTFKIYTNDEIQDVLLERINEANDLLKLDNNDHVMAILRHFDWNFNKLKDHWFEEQDTLVYSIGIEYNKKLIEKYPEIDDSTAAKNSNMCMVMYCEFEDPANPDSDPDMAPVSLVCGHQYSAIAWSEQLKTKVKDEGTACLFTKCPQVRCNVVVPHSYFLKYLKDQEEDGVNYRNKYITWHSMQFIDNNKNMKSCPKAECDRIIQKNEFTLATTVTCGCGESYCFSCEEEQHEPASCGHVQKWIEKEKGGDADNLQWIKANTKLCPKCTTSIEKNAGCSAMICAKCKTGFCWFCLKVYKDAHSCDCYRKGPEHAKLDEGVKA